MDDHFLFHFLLRCDTRPGWGWLYLHPSAPILFRAEGQTKGLHMNECYLMFLVGKLSMKLHVSGWTLRAEISIEGRCMDDRFLFHFLLRCDKRPGCGWLYLHPSAPRLFRAEGQTKGLHMDECYLMFI